MKRTRFLFSVSLTLLLNLQLNAQTFFADSTVWFTSSYFNNVSDIPASYFKEIIQLDSTNSNGEFYHVTRTKYWKPPITYYLKTLDRRVFFTGLIMLGADSILVNDLLIYDFNLTQGDTLDVFLKPDKRLYQCVIDSVQYQTFEDGIARKTQYYSGILIDKLHMGQYIFIAEGLGSNIGLILFELEQWTHANYFLTTVSICKNQTPIYRRLSYFKRLGDNFCNEDSIRKLSVENIDNDRIKFYPNPASNSLHFSGLEQGSFEIYNTHGSLLQSGILEKEISVRDLVPGFYYLLLRNETGVYSGKFVKE